MQAVDEHFANEHHRMQETCNNCLESKKHDPLSAENS